MKKNRGFSLIEVLITLLLTAVGVLGMVALQGQAVSYTQEAISRNTAISMANGLVEILRAYRDEIYVNTPPDNINYSELKSSSDFYNASGALNFAVTDCAEPAQTAKQAAGCWLRKVNASLPGATESAVSAKFFICPSFSVQSSGNTKGEVVCAGNSYKGSSLAIQVAWQSRESVCGANANSDICTYVMRVEI